MQDEREEKTEPPTSTRLAELRSLGVVPNSATVTRCGLVVGVCLSLLFSVSQRVAFLDTVFADSIGFEAVAEAWHWFIVDALVAFIFSAVATLLVSGIVLRPVFTTFTTHRLPILRHLVVYFLTCTAAVWMVVKVFLPLLSLFSRDGEDAVIGLTTVMRWVLIRFCAVAVLVGLVAGILARVAFSRRHRMSRREIESEQS